MSFPAIRRAALRAAAVAIAAWSAGPSHAAPSASIAAQGFDDNSILSALAPGGPDARAWDAPGMAQDGTGWGWSLSGATPTNHGDRDLIGVLPAGASTGLHGRDIAPVPGASGGVLYVEDTDTPLILTMAPAATFGWTAPMLELTLAATAMNYDAGDGFEIRANGVVAGSWYGEAMRTLVRTSADFTQVVLDLSAFEETILSLELAFISDAKNEDFALDGLRLTATPAAVSSEVPAPPAALLFGSALLAGLGLARLRGQG